MMSEVNMFTGCRIEGRASGRRRSSRSPVRKAIEPAVAALFEVPLSDLRGQTRGSPQAAFARQVAMYLSHVVLGLSLTEVGMIFSRDRTTVAHACAMIEDGRDDPEFDARLDQLEQAICSMVDALFARRV